MVAKDGLGELLAGAVRDKTVLLVPTAMETQLRLPAFEQAAWLPIQHVLLTQTPTTVIDLAAAAAMVSFVDPHGRLSF